MTGLSKLKNEFRPLFFCGPRLADQQRQVALRAGGIFEIAFKGDAPGTFFPQ